MEQGRSPIRWISTSHFRLTSLIKAKESTTSTKPAGYYVCHTRMRASEGRIGWVEIAIALWSSSGALQRITEIGEEAEEEDRRIVFAVSVLWVLASLWVHISLSSVFSLAWLRLARYNASDRLDSLTCIAWGGVKVSFLALRQASGQGFLTVFQLESNPKWRKNEKAKRKPSTFRKELS